METIKEKIHHLNELVLSGKTLDAFEMYYHDEVIMQENETAPTIGKDANRKREHEFFSAVKEFRGAHVLDVAVAENVSFVKWHYDYDHEDWGTKNYQQVSVQHWKDGKIIKDNSFMAIK